MNSNNSYIGKGKVIALTLENCKVKTRSFNQEVMPDGFPSGSDMLDTLSDSNRSYKTEALIQTYLVFEAVIRGQAYKFISHPVNQDPFFLRQQLEKGKINLVFDPVDPNSYRFNMEGM